MRFEETSREIVEKILRCSTDVCLSSFDRQLLLSWKDQDHSLIDPVLLAQSNGIQSDKDKHEFVLQIIMRKLARLSLELKLKIYQQVFVDMPTELAKQLAKVPDLDLQSVDQTVSDTTTATDNMLTTKNTAALLSGAVYGEIEFSSFGNILQRCMSMLDQANSTCSSSSNSNSIARQQRVFVDLGHGTGKALVAAALLYHDRLSAVCGIEYAPGLVKESLNRIELFQTIVRNNYPLFFHPLCEIVAQEGDFLLPSVDNSEFGVLDWTTAGKPNLVVIIAGKLLTVVFIDVEIFCTDIVFANSTCFNSDMMLKLGTLSETMRTGTLFVSLTYPLPSAISSNPDGSARTPSFRIVEHRNYPMSWGLATAYFQQKL
jgi:hypothetical protein